MASPPSSRDGAPEPASQWGAEPTPDTTPVLALRVPEAAEVLSLSTRTLERLIKAGEIRTIKLGGKRQSARLIPVAELNRWLAARLDGPGDAK